MAMSEANQDVGGGADLGAEAALAAPATTGSNALGCVAAAVVAAAFGALGILFMVYRAQIGRLLGM